MANGWGGARPNSGPKKRRPRDGGEIARERKVEAACGFTANFARQVAEASASARRLENLKRDEHPELNPFQIPQFPAHATPPKEHRMAMDEWASGQWTANPWSPSLIAGNIGFPGFAYLAELALRTEYRVMSETIATELTRKWIKFEGKGKEDKTDKIRELMDEVDRLRVRDCFGHAALLDGFMGRGQIYLDVEGVDWDNTAPDAEISTDLGDGSPRNTVSKSKVGKDRRLKGLRVIEPIWSYPTAFNASNPLAPNWYKPDHWYVMGRSVHRSRMLTFVGHPVPDIFKPAFAFGGVSLSQMAQPYVDIWLTTRQSIGQLVHSFSTMVLMTNLGTLLQPGNLGTSATGLINRADAFNALRDNQGLFVVDKTTEDFKNVSTPLGGLHELQAQAQEHMMSAVRIPSVKFTGIQPSGLNACLTGDTLVETDQGHVPIKDVHAGQRVMTREGWAPIAKAGCTGFALELVEIEVGDSTLRCTANHRIWLPSTNAFVPAGNVRPGDLLLCRGEIGSRNTEARSPTGVDFGGTEGTAITPLQRPTTDSFCFTERFGAFITGIFRKVGISITLTETARTRITRGFTALPLGSSFANQWNMSANVAIAASGSSCRRQRESCFAAIGAGSPIGVVASRRGQSLARYVLVSCAAFLLRRSEGMQSIALDDAQRRAKTAPRMRQSITKKIAKSGSSTGSAETYGVVSSVRRVLARELVYDIQIASGHLPEFFANGVCVHNSSDGEIRVFYDTIIAYAEHLFRRNLTTVIDFAMRSLWGEADPDITWSFVPLHALTEKEAAEVNEIKCRTDDLLVNGVAAISPAEVRRRVTLDESSGYAGLNPEDLPEPPQEEGMGGETGMPGGEEGGPGAPGPARPAPGGGGGSISLRGTQRYQGGERGGEDAPIPFARDAAEWREGDHPRDEGGKFSAGGAEENEPAASAGHPGLSWFEDEPDDFYGPAPGKSPQVPHAPQYGLEHGFFSAPSAFRGAFSPSAWHAHSNVGAPIDPAKMKKVGGQMGSNPGGVYEDASGKRFYVKQGKSKDHVANEMLAAALYRVAGAPTLRYRPVEGGAQVATEMEKLDKDNASKLSAKEIAEARKDFAVHAWLANWDAVGAGGDNLAVVRAAPTAIDLGGALDYRAQGKAKGKAFGDEAGEVDTLRDKDTNPDAAAIFGGITPAQFRESARFVAKVTDKEIRAAVAKAGKPEALAEKLIARRDDVKERARAFGAEGDPKSPQGVVVVPVGGELPVKKLNGVKFDRWRPPADWNAVDGQADIREPPFRAPEAKHGLKPKELASGCIVREPDGRVWIVQPRGGYMGYEGSFPKGHLEKGLSPQANAIKECWEESGLKVRIVGLEGDHEGDQTVTRYYTAVREGGDPADHGDETEGVVLAPPGKLKGFLNRARDLEILKGIGGGQAHDEAPFEESDHPRDESGKFTSKGAGNLDAFYKEASKIKKKHGSGSFESGSKKVVAAVNNGVGPDALQAELTPVEKHELEKYYGSLEKAFQAEGYSAPGHGSSEEAFQDGINKINEQHDIGGGSGEGNLDTAEEKIAIAVEHGLSPDEGIVVGSLSDDELLAVEEAHGSLAQAYEAMKDAAANAKLAEQVKAEETQSKEASPKELADLKDKAAKLGLAEPQQHPTGMWSSPATNGPQGQFNTETEVLEAMIAAAEQKSMAEPGGKAKKTAFGGLWKETGGGEVEEFQVNSGIVLGKPANAGQSYRKMLAFLIKQADKWESSGVPGAGDDAKALRAKLAEALYKAQAKAIASGTEKDVTKLTAAITAMNAKEPAATKAGFDAYMGAGGSPALAASAPKQIPAEIEKYTPKFAAALKEMAGKHKNNSLISALAKAKAAVNTDASEEALTAALTMEEKAALQKQAGSVGGMYDALKKNAQVAASGAGAPKFPAPTEAELAKAKKSAALQLQYVPGAPPTQEAQKLVDEFNKKYKGKDIADQPGLIQKVNDFKAMQAKMAPLAEAHAKAQQAEASKTAEQQAAAKKAELEAAKKAKAEAKEKNAKVMKDLGITEAEADGFDGLVSMMGGKQGDVVESFKSYEKQAKSYGYPITGFQAALINNYTGSGYQGVNAALRSGSWSVKQHVYVKLMNKALRAMPTYEGTVKRGTSLDFAEQSKYKAGYVVPQSGFTSASVTHPWSGNTQYTIKAIGKHGAHVKKLSSHPGEDEVVFAAGTAFKITKVEGQPGGQMHVWMEELED